MKTKILIGYGNPDREDDGVAWHLLNAVAAHTCCGPKDLFTDEVIQVKEGLDVWFNFQLLPEMAETIAEYDQAIFIDAHTGEIKEDISFVPVKPEFQNSPFTHHFTPASCLAVAQSLTGHHPESWLLSVRGYQFGFSQELSSRTRSLLEEAFNRHLKPFLE